MKPLFLKDLIYRQLFSEYQISVISVYGDHLNLKIVQILLVHTVFITYHFKRYYA